MRPNQYLTTTSRLLNGFLSLGWTVY